MNSYRPFRKPLTIGIMLIAAQSFAGAEQKTEQKTDAEAIEKIVHNYIIDHPEVVLESVRGFDARAKEAEKERSREALKSHLGELYNNSPLLESTDKGSYPVTVVEFFDNRCGYCKQVENTVTNLTQTPGIRIVYKELPILGPESVIAAQAALAADKQGAYQKFHHALLTSHDQISQDSVEKLASQLGLDVARLKKDMSSPEVSAAVAQNLKLAETLGVKATPTFVVGDQMMAGALTADAFQSLINGARHTSPAGQKEEGQ